MSEQLKNTRKVREGVVLSNKMQKTVTVRVERMVTHPDFDKRVIRAKKYYAHVDNNDIQVGQRVRIEETRPLSKLKRWRVVEVVA
ncbi:MAG: 30S ribosomal protein S17 [Chlamydiae bacterium]|jgi:small subunit ribosomal protein S17|nr:30S ribosomal protein S17 [Chlamydiota bacterium]